MSKQNTIRYVIIGALAGAVNGLFGAGGGLVVVPLLIAWTGLSQKGSFATSVAIIAPLSAISFCLLQQRQALDLKTVWGYLLGGVIGGVLSGFFFKKASPALLHRLFGALLLYGGIRAVLR